MAYQKLSHPGLSHGFVLQREGPELLCEELKAQWAAHVAIQDAADESVDVVAFLRSVDQPGWVAFEITSCGMACGPVCNTTWTVLDLS